jgi:hypothetical protein
VINLILPSVLQLQEHVDEPVGMALYEMKGGQLSNIMMQGGDNA